ncbi:MAG: diguanylate cyclase [Nitrospiraceae bacterium]|nr:MAG: diguanylate cyclase [Nitrospiraceae bacterium]
MTIIDLIIIVITLILFWNYYQNRKLLKQLKMQYGVTIILGGFYIMAFLYYVDILAMHVFPIFMPRKQSMEIMTDLHLNYSWILSATGFFLLLIGMVYLNKIIFPRIILYQKKLELSSITDELTDLLNRRGFLKFAQKQIEIANRHKSHFSLLFLDLNDMKAINDEFGHHEGDQALINLTNILNRTFRSSDIISRMGGDEFAVLMTGARGTATEKAVIDNLLDNLRNYNEKTEKGYTLSVSTGIVYYDPAHPCVLEDLLLRADKLMYENKQRYQLEKAGIKQPKKITRERRIDKRYDVENKHKIELVVPDSVKIINISMNGICLETRQRLTKNTAYSVRISPHNEKEEIVLTGFVVWSTFEEIATGQGNEAAYNQSGLRFVGMNDSSKDLLKKYLTDLQKGDFALSFFQ